MLLALGLAATAAAVVYLSRPTTLTVAVGPQDGPEAALMEAYANALSRAREDVRLKVVRYADVRDSAAALKANKADLAVVRPDVLLPENGLTLAILHDEALIVAASEAGEIDDFPDLARRRLGIVVTQDAFGRLSLARIIERATPASPFDIRYFPTYDDALGWVHDDANDAAAPIAAISGIDARIRCDRFRRAAASR